MPFEEKVSSILSDDSPTDVIVLDDGTEILCVSERYNRTKLLLVSAFWPASIHAAAERIRSRLSERYRERPVVAAPNCQLVGARFVVNVSVLNLCERVHFGTTIKAVEAINLPISA